MSSSKGVSFVEEEDVEEREEDVAAIEQADIEGAWGEEWGAVLGLNTHASHAQHPVFFFSISFTLSHVIFTPSYPLSTQQLASRNKT